MASSAKVYISAYLVRNGEKTVGCTVKSSVIDGVRTSRLIGFDLNPCVDDYLKVIQLVGDTSLDGFIIPDILLLVKTDDFFRGKFTGIETKRENRLRKQYTLKRGEKKVSVFTSERVQFSRNMDNRFDVTSLKTLLGGAEWQPVSKISDVKQGASSSTGATTIISKSTGAVKKDIANKPAEKKKKRVSVKFQNVEPEGDILYQTLHASGETKYLEKYGDLFDAPSGLIVNCISADAHMGKGIATMFAVKYPDDKIALGLQNLRVGVTYFFGKHDIVQRGYLVTKDVYSSKPTEIAIQACLKSLFHYCMKNAVKEVHMPRIASGLDRMDWVKIREMVISSIGELSLKCVVYVWNGAENS